MCTINVLLLHQINPCRQSTPLSGRLFVRRFITLSLVSNANIYDQSLDSVGLVLRFVWLSGQISEKTPQSCPCNPKIGLYVCVRFCVHVRVTKKRSLSQPELEARVRVRVRS